MSNHIQPYNREGAWVSSYLFYYETAHLFRDRYNESINTLLSAEKSIRKENSNENPDILSSLVSHETHNLREESYRNATASTLFACMAIEGFINDYGSRRIGENFYKKNLERIGITEKLSIILLTCLDIKLEKNDPILKTTRKIFDRRNSLVHPKTREFDSNRIEDFVTKHPAELTIDDVLDDTTYLIKLLSDLDPDINISFQTNLYATEQK